MTKEEIDCIYCSEPFECIIEYEDLSKTSSEFIFVNLNGDKLSVDATAGVYEPNYLEAEGKINYCPMCGRKLGDKHDN